MQLLEWIKVNRPGNVSEYDDRFEIDHQSGEHSTLFKKNDLHKNSMDFFKALGDVYSVFDGVDLFSSTFKIASADFPKFIGEVELIENLSEFQERVKELNPNFPELSVPFMYQAGIGIYAIGKKSGKIYEWDDEEGVLSDEFDSLDQVLTEWLEALA